MDGFHGLCFLHQTMLRKPEPAWPYAFRAPRTGKTDRGLHLKPVQVLQMGIPHFPEGFHRLVRPLARPAI